MKTFYALALCAAVVATLGSPGTAHDLRGLHNVLAQQAIGEKIRTAQTSAQSATGVSFAAKGIFETLTVWRPLPHALSICFQGGGPNSTKLRQHILDSMKRAWPLLEKTAGMLKYGPSFAAPMDCPSSDPQTVGADIRVAFLSGANGGYWSYVGTSSLLYVPSMNFEGFDSSPPPEPQFTQIVAHEMGHALGLDHEHQSPSAPDCLWNFNYIFTQYQWTSYEDMTANLTRLVNYKLANGLPYYQVTDYDKGSIMHYYFEAAAFSDGTDDKCYINHQALLPDDTDYRSIANAYPYSATPQAQLFLKAIHETTLIPAALQSNQVRSLLQAKAASVRHAILEGAK